MGDTGTRDRLGGDADQDPAHGGAAVTTLHASELLHGDLLGGTHLEPHLAGRGVGHQRCRDGSKGGLREHPEQTVESAQADHQTEAGRGFSLDSEESVYLLERSLTGAEGAVARIGEQARVRAISLSVRRLMAAGALA